MDCKRGSRMDDRPTIEAPDDDPYLWLEDIEGARANDVRGLGVAWGFGSIEELCDAGAHAIAANPAALAELLEPAI